MQRESGERLSDYRSFLRIKRKKTHAAKKTIKNRVKAILYKNNKE